MRDPERISKILSRLEKIWKQNPDLKLIQLITNVINPMYLYEINDEVLISLMEKTYDP